eukprot:17396_1
MAKIDNFVYFLLWICFTICQSFECGPCNCDTFNVSEKQFTRVSCTKSFSDAQQYCRDYFNGYVATIHNDAQNNYLCNHCPSGVNCWIGWHDQDNDGVSTWDSGSLSDYHKLAVSSGWCVCVDRSGQDWSNCQCSDADHQYFYCDVLPLDSCEDSGYILHPNWEVVNGLNDIYNDYSIIVNSDDLSVDFKVELAYIGYSYAPQYGYAYGTMYNIDFKSFDVAADSIKNPGSCSNHLASTFENKTWQDCWTYSNTPYKTGHLGNAQYPVYGPSGENWILSMDTTSAWSTCSRIQYNAHFTWQTLSECTDGAGNKVININTENETIDLNGRLYVNLVSPISMSDDFNAYYSHNILTTREFRISLINSAHVISSTGIKLFLITILHAERRFDEHSNDGSYHIFIFTQTASYLKLTSPLTVTDASSDVWQIQSVRNEECLFLSSNICTQRWEIYVENASCPFEFGGTFTEQWTAECTTNNQQCDDYLNTYGNKVDLTVDYSYSDILNCSDIGEIAVAIFDGNMTFYIDNYSIENTGNYLYKSGVDRIYIEVFVNIPISSRNALNASLENVWLCTTDKSVTIDQNNQINSGCFDISSVDDGSLVNVIINGEPQNFNAIIEPDDDNNVVRFNFLTPNWLPRPIIYIHVEIKIISIGILESRRLLSKAGNLNTHSFSHVVATVHVNNDKDTDSIPETEEKTEPKLTDSFIVILIAILCILVAIVGIVIYCIVLKIKMQPTWRKTAIKQSVNNHDNEIEDNENEIEDNENETVTISLFPK